MNSTNIQTVLFIEALLNLDSSAIARISSLASTERPKHEELARKAHEEAIAFLKQLPASGTGEEKVKRLYFDGCFDLMHSGHFNALRQAKELCETLVVGVITSEAIRKAKGPPIMTDEERLALVRACKWADEVVIQETYDPTLETLDRHNCSHVAHGDDLVQTADGQDAYKPFKDTGRMKYQ